MASPALGKRPSRSLGTLLPRSRAAARPGTGSSAASRRVIDGWRRLRVGLRLETLVLGGVSLYFARSARLLVERHLRDLAISDDLTGLAQRRVFVGTVEREISLG